MSDDKFLTFDCGPVGWHEGCQSGTCECDCHGVKNIIPIEVPRRLRKRYEEVEIYHISAIVQGNTFDAYQIDNWQSVFDRPRYSEDGHTQKAYGLGPIRS